MLDLASLESITAFGDRLREQRDHLDVLVNNARVMTPPKRRTTGGGLELQFGTNYLGHFALTAHLLPLLRKGRSPRAVTFPASSRGTRPSTSTICKQNTGTSRCRSIVNPSSLA